MIPATFTIGDDLPFDLNDVQGGRDHTPLTGATVTWEFVDKQTRTVIASGSMDLYDDVAASFEGVVEATHLGLYDAVGNPNGIIPGREYVLRATINDSGVHTTKSATSRAVLDPPDQP